jgi:hypothetical protein
MFLVARELKAKKGKKVTSMTDRHRAIMKDIDEKKEALAETIVEVDEEEDED